MNLIKGVKAKIRNKENMPFWYYERVDICNECPENSKNNSKISLKNKIRLSHNLGKDACLICSCGIEDLASDPTIKCSALIPKWDWIRIPDFDIKFNLENYSPTKGALTRKGKYYFYDFGNISLSADATAILFLGEENELNNFKVMSSCGCTKPEFLRNEKGYLISVSYDTKLIGSFEKQVSISFSHKKEGKKYLTFWIKGRVLE